MKTKSKITNPELFQGKSKTKNYFEGWYFKHSANDAKTNFSIIPGVNYENDSKGAFIQVITGPPYRSYYIEYDYADFSYSDEPFTIRIGKSVFTKEYIELDIDDEQVKIKGRVDYGQLTPIDRTFFQPNIMGFFAYFKFMQCNHGVISLGHDLSGQLQIDDKSISFDGGRGYIEKDWGTSFPKKYCWIQCNHFEDEADSLFFSLAHIPFLGFEFMGFIGILRAGGRQYRFATYNGAKVKKARFSEGDLVLSVLRKKYTLNIRAQVKGGRVLKAPKEGIMAEDITETLEGIVDFELYHNDNLVHNGKSQNAGIEVVNFKEIYSAE